MLLIFLPGPVVSVLLLNFGARFVVILGSVLIAVGTLSSAYVPNIYYLYLTFSIINGESCRYHYKYISMKTNDVQFHAYA